MFSPVWVLWVLGVSLQHSGQRLAKYSKRCSETATCAPQLERWWREKNGKIRQGSTGVLGRGGGALNHSVTCVSPVRHLPEHEWTKYHCRYTQKCTQCYNLINNVAWKCGALYDLCSKHLIFLLQPIWRLTQLNQCVIVEYEVLKTYN